MNSKLAMFMVGILIGKGVTKMAKYKFKKESKTVESYVILILAGKKTFEQVPNIFNLREVVAEVLGLEEEQA